MSGLADSFREMWKTALTALGQLNTLVPDYWDGALDTALRVVRTALPLFAAVLLGGLLRRESLADAVRRAVDFVAACVRSTWEAGTPAAHGVLLERELGRLTR